MNLKKILFCLSFGLLPFGLFAQPNINPKEEQVFSDKIKTIILTPTASDMSLPILELGTADKLLLQFDELVEESNSYRYKIQNCTAEWTISDLKLSQYLDGFDDFAIEDPKYSFNTIQPYVHYSALIPNDMTKLKVSGNYLLTVYPQNDEDNPIFTRQFRVKESSLLTIRATIRVSSDVAERTQQQEVDLSISPSENTFIQNPKDYLKVFVQQNGRRDLMRKINLQGIKGNDYNYVWNPENYFNGGNEYRNVDIKNIKIRSRFVDRVEYINGENHTFMLPEKDRSKLPYETVDDIDGKMKIHADFTTDSQIEGDYTWVHFTVPYSTPRLDGSFYIVGQLTDWYLNDASKMQYDQRKGGYFFEKYLKQGYYNYLVLFKGVNDSVGNPSIFEGNHVETENEYTIFVYYKRPSDLSDRLIGFSVINSRK